MPVLLKICGLTRAEDALAAAAAGATYGGVILAPGGPRSVAPGAARAIFAASPLARCGVFVDEPIERLLERVEELALDVVQLHGDETPELAAAVRAGTRAGVWKAIRPRDGAEFVEAAETFEGAVDGLLLDGFSDAARGGTGTRFPWEEVARHRGRLAARLRLIVAGGLRPENVARAIELLEPDVVDVSSGVELSPGVKDPAAIRKFAEAVRDASTPEGVG
jgi:phosphoribosylanthranilate isomerase